MTELVSSAGWFVSVKGAAIMMFDGKTSSVGQTTPHARVNPKLETTFPGGAYGWSVWDRLSDRLHSWFERYVAAEHKCVPPDDQRSWYAVASADPESFDPHVYACPECGQHWATVAAGKTSAA